MTTTTLEPSGSARAAIEAKRGLVRTERSYTVEGIQVRGPAADGDHFAEFYGHASVTGKGYDMYGGPDKGGWNETVDKGAFKRTLDASPDVPFLVNHTGMTLARTTAGNLHLREDATGLEVKAPKLDTRVSIVNDLVLLMEAGNINEMSFAFRVRKQVWLDADGEEVPWWDMSGVDRHLVELDIHKGDVSVVNYGANPYTDAKLRSLDDAMRELTADADSLDETDLRSAIAHLESLLPAPSVDTDLLRAVTESAKRAWLAKHDAA